MFKFLMVSLLSHIEQVFLKNYLITHLNKHNLHGTIKM
jgi:hypothetical protein